MDSKKVLVIKTGYSEFLDREKNSRRTSLGDVLRSTVLLHLYKEDRVSWVTDRYAFPLLENNPYIERLLPYDLTTVLQLESEEFDTVINLEKVPGICALADKIRARRSRFGFTFNTQTGDAEAYDRAYEVLDVSAIPELKKANKKTFQELLFEMLGKRWNGEEYILNYTPRSEEVYDFGLNTQIGQKWPIKSWPSRYWDELEDKLEKKGFKVSRQDKQPAEVLTNLYCYMDWINSCKCIISNDSLGVHLAIAMKKKVLGLFGPTTHTELCFYGLGKALEPKNAPDCMPCFEKECKRKRSCIEDIFPEEVFKEAIASF